MDTEKRHKRQCLMYSIIGVMITGGFLTVAFILMFSNPPQLIDDVLNSNIIDIMDNTRHDILTADVGEHAIVCVDDNCITVLPDKNGDIIIGG